MKIPTNPSSIKTRFAIRFLQAMKKLNKNKPPSKKYHFIRAAASSSMASAVGPRRVWSRAVLRKMIKNRQYYSTVNNRRRSTHRLSITRRKRVLIRGNPRGFEEEDDTLRGLVPGGEGMDFCRLLTETAHYIKCLRAQIQVMTNILNHYSTCMKQ